MIKVGSRDLSERFEGELEIRIEGVGMKKVVLDNDRLAEHVATLHYILTKDVIDVPNAYRAPWEIVSFNRITKKLVVRPVH